MSTQIFRTARGRGLAAISTVLALSVVGCVSGADRPRADRLSSPSPSATGLGSVRVLYRYEETIDGEKSRIDWEVITGLPHRARYTITGGFNADGPAIGTYFVYDGKVLLTYEPDANPKFYLTKHPAKSDIPLRSSSLAPTPKPWPASARRHSAAANRPSGDAPRSAIPARRPRRRKRRGRPSHW